MNVKNYIVQENKSNKQQFINLSKKDNFVTGENVIVTKEKLRFHTKEVFEGYIKTQEEKIKNCIKEVLDVRKRHCETKEHKEIYDSTLSKKLGLGEFINIYEEPLRFTKSKYSFDYYCDDIVHDELELEEYLNKENVEEYSKVVFFQKVLNRDIDLLNMLIDRQFKRNDFNKCEDLTAEDLYYESENYYLYFWEHGIYDDEVVIKDKNLEYEIVLKLK